MANQPFYAPTKKPSGRSFLDVVERERVFTANAFSLVDERATRLAKRTLGGEKDIEAIRNLTDPTFLALGDARWVTPSSGSFVAEGGADSFKADLGGSESITTSAECLLIGVNSTIPAGSTNNLLIGNDITGTVGLNNILIGNGANTTAGDDSVNIGVGVTGGRDRCVIIGKDADDAGTFRDDAVMVGYAATANDNSVAIGSSARAGGDGNGSDDCVAIGFAALADTARAVVIGSSATTGVDSVVVGYHADATTRAVALGANAQATQTDSIAIGHEALATAANQLVIGSVDADILTCIIGGEGDIDATPPNVAWRITDGVGTDIAGADLSVSPGMGTSAGAPGVVNFSTGRTLTTGAVLQTATVTLRVGELFAELPSEDIGNDITGPQLRIGRNTNAGQASAGSLRLTDLGGTDYFFWVDDTGALRTHTAQPTGANDLDGSTVGGGGAFANAAGVVTSLAALTTMHLADAAVDATPTSAILAPQDATGTDINGGGLRLRSGFGTGTGVSGLVTITTGVEGTTGTTPNATTTVMTFAAGLGPGQEAVIFAQMGDIDSGNDVTGPQFQIGRNANAGQASAGSIVLTDLGNTDYFFWVDDTGKLRTDTSAPTGTGDLGGSLVANAGFVDGVTATSKYVDFGGTEHAGNAGINLVIGTDCTIGSLGPNDDGGNILIGVSSTMGIRTSNSVLIGRASSIAGNFGTSTTLIGANCSTTTNDLRVTGVGQGVTLTATDASAFGDSATAGFEGTALGAGSVCNAGTGGLAVGFGADCQHTGSIALGYQALTTATGQVIIGAPGNGSVTSLVFGEGVADGTPGGPMNWRTTNRSSGVGADVAASAWEFRSGGGTGQGTGSTFDFITSRRVASGSTVHGSGTTLTIGEFYAEFPSEDIGNDITGPQLRIGRNTNVTQESAGSLRLTDLGGTDYFFWVDDTGVLRSHTAAPTGTTDLGGSAFAVGNAFITEGGTDSWKVNFGGAEAIGASSDQCILIGVGADIGGANDRNVLIGNGALISGGSCNDNVVIGDQAVMATTSGENVVIGSQADTNSTPSFGNVVIGYNVTVNGDNNVNIGRDSAITADSNHSILVGESNSTAHDNVQLYGNSLASTADNQVIIGGNSSVSGQSTQTYIFGQGSINTNAHASVLWRTSDDSGTNQVGRIVNIAPGMGTGTSTPAQINFQTGRTLGTGTTTHTRTTTFSVGELFVELPSEDTGNDITGPQLRIGRNTNATQESAGSIRMTDLNGTEYFLWVDDTGDLRIHTAAPTGLTDVSAGVVVGTQS